ncbi:protein phosphatase 2C domain-containing protein [Streptomyces sp. NPDC127084]|uniref:protein phosphatase 2C domain-containing protein n=1 Tax=Streptomyces sp. NPDC127084 TaxID=3347133 RepID=UPI0036570C05
MNEQGESPAFADDWWHRLYDASAPDTGPGPSAGDTVDDRYASAVDTVGPEPGSTAPLGLGRTPVRPASGTAPAPEPSSLPVPDSTPPTSPRAARPGAWWDSLLPGARAPWESPPGEPSGTLEPPERHPVATGAEDGIPTGGIPDPRGNASRPTRRLSVGHVGDGPPTYNPEPTALPPADPHELDALVADTVLDGASYGTYTLRAASVRGDSARFRGEPRRDVLLTARFGSGEEALVLVAVATGTRAGERTHLAAADLSRWIGTAVGRSHARLADDIRAGRRGDLKSGLHRLTDRSLGKLRGRAGELGVSPEEYTAGLRCLLLSADPDCRTRVFFGVGRGGLFRLRDGAWQDLDPRAPEAAATPGEPVVGYGSPPSTPPQPPPRPAASPTCPPSETPEGDRLTMDLGISTPPAPHIDAPVPPPAEPFRFRASVARPGDTLLLCSAGLADPLRGEPALADRLAQRWSAPEPPGLAAYLADTQLRVKGYADDRTACAVWEA